MHLSGESAICLWCALQSSTAGFSRVPTQSAAARQALEPVLKGASPAKQYELAPAGHQTRVAGHLVPPLALKLPWIQAAGLPSPARELKDRTV